MCIRGGQHVALLLFAVLSICRPAHRTADSDCSWDQANLLPWSSARTWDEGKVPKEDDRVVIKTGKHVLLDAQPAPLATLTIETNASLVWGKVPNLELRAEYILVHGTFHIGSRNCRFELPASIKLTGLPDSKFQVFDHRKVLMVAENGTLEIHGKRKTSWTRLAQTIPSINDMTCTYIYNHSNIKANPFARDRGAGLHVIVWNKNGTVFDYSVFQVYTSLKEFITTVPFDKVIGMYAFLKVGLGKRQKRNLNFTALDDVIVNDLGGSLITKATVGDSYSLLTRMGQKSTTIEHYKRNGRKDTLAEERYLQLPVWDTGVAFQVATSASTPFNFFRAVPTDVAYPILELAENVKGWNPGSKIVVASTDFQWEQAEVREIVKCRGMCDRSKIRVNESFRYQHYGNFTYNVDERAEVGLLNRNIVIEGVMQEECKAQSGKELKLCERFGQDTFGGHIKVLRGFTAVHIQGVELFHMGQQGVLEVDYLPAWSCKVIQRFNGYKFAGAYPLHFHMCDEAPGSWFRDNSIHQSFSRCITLHGTDKAEVSGNVCYDHLGHGYFVEDSVEQNNIINGNLGLATKHGTLLMSDSLKVWCKEDYPGKDWTDNCDEVSTFWITHPNNELSNNAAAGGWGHGYMYVFAELPLGDSFERQQELGKVKPRSARSTPFKKFYNNVAHSYRRSGIFIDSRISTGRRKIEKGLPENGIIQDENMYEPRDPPGDPNGRHVWTKLERVTCYKNRQNNMWVKGGNINVTFCSLADPSSQSFSGGATGLQTGVSFEYGIMIGYTDNVGTPTLYKEILQNGTVLPLQFNRNYGASPWSTITGFGIYQGPMFAKHSYFDRFNTLYWNDNWTEILGKRPVSYAGAISFKKDSTYPTYTSQYTTNLTFGYCDNVSNAHWLFFGNTSEVWHWRDLDGTKNAHNWDRDGSLTGTPNTYIVQNRPFFTGPECQCRPDWGMSVCPYRYIKMEILGKGGSLSERRKDQWALIAYRDDVPNDPFYQKGQQRREYLARTYNSYLIDFNTTMKGAAFPYEIKVQGYGVEIQDVVRVGICVPMDLTKFEVHSTYPVLQRKDRFTKVYNMNDLDADKNKSAVFHDTKNGIIFFKIWSRYNRTNDSQLCPAGNCFNIRFILNNGNRRRIRSCFGAKYPSFNDPRPTPTIPVMKPCRIGSPEGLGAVRWNEVKKIVHKNYYVPCASPAPALKGRTSYRGCYRDTTQNFEIKQKSQRSMMVDWCIYRCKQRNYKYAALQKRVYCSCGDTIDNPESMVPDSECSATCVGNTRQKCGHVHYLSIWTTGLVPEVEIPQNLKRLFKLHHA